MIAEDYADPYTCNCADGSCHCFEPVTYSGEVCAECAKGNHVEDNDDGARYLGGDELDMPFD